jgi:hypothetical protein
VLGDPALRQLGRRRGRDARAHPGDAAQPARVLSAVPGRDFGYFLSQRGMFSYTGLSAGPGRPAAREFGVYLIRSGRMCVAGLNTGNVDRTAEAMAAGGEGSRHKHQCRDNRGIQHHRSPLRERTTFPRPRSPMFRLLTKR